MAELITLTVKKIAPSGKGFLADTKEDAWVNFKPDQVSYVPQVGDRVTVGLNWNPPKEGKKGYYWANIIAKAETNGKPVQPDKPKPQPVPFDQEEPDHIKQDIPDDKNQWLQEDRKTVSIVRQSILKAVAGTLIAQGMENPDDLMNYVDKFVDWALGKDIK